MTRKKLEKLFVYKDGALLRRNDTVAGKAMEKVGADSGQGYFRVYLKGKRVFVHKIVWILHHGEIPNLFQIDHINGKRGDNRIENLRLVTVQDNHKNKRRPTTNTSGVIGVNWKKERSRWRVSIGNGTKHGKFIGYFIGFDDAVKARKQAEKEYGFHENHGR